LQLGKNGGSFVVVPTASADKTVTRRSAEGSLSADGTLQAAVTIEFKGNQALQHRLDALGRDEAGRKGNLEDELRSWLPDGAGVRLKEVHGWDSSDEPLLVFFDITVPAFGTVSGKRLLVPANLFHSPQMEAFSSAERKYPLYFPFTYEEIDKLALQVPDGYSLALLPEGQDVKLSSTRFITTRSAQQNQLFTTRALVVNSIYFQPDQYPGLRSFFQKLQSADEEQVVMEKQ
jgi:hypothetical protein